MRILTIENKSVGSIILSFIFLYFALIYSTRVYYNLLSLSSVEMHALNLPSRCPENVGKQGRLYEMKVKATEDRINARHSMSIEVRTAMQRLVPLPRRMQVQYYRYDIK